MPTPKKPNARQGARAKLAYPYYPLDNALRIAELIHKNAGGPCTPHQLVGFLNYTSVRSGAYQMRTSAARQFGFIRYSKDGISVTERAEKILNPVMPEDAIAAKSDAFLAVDMYEQIYEKFKGRVLPPEEGLKNLLRQEYNLSGDRAGPATRVFLASAEQAGFLKESGGKLRLVEPVIRSSGAKPAPEKESATPEVEKPDLDSVGIHSAILGLLQELPSAKKSWTKSQKEAFKTAFLATLDLIYPAEGKTDGE